MIQEDLRTLRRNAAAGIYPPDAMPNWVHPTSAGRARRLRHLFMRIVGDGVVGGVVASAAIAAFFALMSLLGGHSPFHLAGLLGAAAGFGDTASPVLAYTLLHGVVLVLIGIVTAALARLAAAALQGWYIAVIGVLFIIAHIVALPLWFGTAMQSHLSLPIVAFGTTLGVAAMCAYLWWRNPAITDVAHEVDEQA